VALNNAPSIHTRCLRLPARWGSQCRTAKYTENFPSHSVSVRARTVKKSALVGEETPERFIAQGLPIYQKVDDR
jgi:hypothetical protein